MFRSFWILFLSCVALLLTGCPASAPQKPPIWEQAKIGDLAPHGTTEPNQQLSDIINFDVYVFEIPATDANILDNIWPALYTQPLQFNSYSALAMNLFAAGFGQPQDWNRIAEYLRNANARRAERNSLILLSGQLKDLYVTSIDSEKTIFYTSVSHVSEGVTIGPGSFVLQIKAQKIPAQRGVCNINIQPVFTPSRKSRFPLRKETETTAPFAFDALELELKMSPGDFLLLGPKRYTADKSGLAGLFFSADIPRPVAKLYLFVCGEIAD
jgi:hypothetical protein